MKELLDELKLLNLPEGEFVVFGSGPMEAHGIRKAGDLDLLVTDKLWDELVAAGNQPIVDDWDMIDADGVSRKVHKEKLNIGNIELYHTWPDIEETPTEVINNADVFDGVRFGKLEYVLEWKRNFNRPKDKADVKLIEEYLDKQ